MAKNEITSASIRMAAMNILAMREHSAKELTIKLNKKFEQVEWVLDVVKKLQNDDLQSDQRFTEAYVNIRLRQGKGAAIIRMELKEKGIAEEIMDEHLSNAIDWNALALQVYQKKFMAMPILDMKEKSKRIRFLTARGFSSGNIQYAFKYSIVETKS